jgi:tRNA(Ile)-lysidine synthase
MLKLLFPLPNQLTVALSGGVDSVAVTDFLSRKHDVACAFFHHGTENSERAFDFVSKFCSERSLPLFMGMISKERSKDQSMEEHWRNERYQFLESLNSTVVTAHNLDDCVETYLYGSLHGQPKVIPHRRNNIVRPFLTTQKREFVGWCQRKGIEWCEDASNQDVKYMRNYIRNEIVPRAYVVNPGLGKVVKKIVESKMSL